MTQYGARHLLIKFSGSRNPVSRRTNQSTAEVTAEAATAELQTYVDKINAEGATEQVRQPATPRHHPHPQRRHPQPQPLSATTTPWRLHHHPPRYHPAPPSRRASQPASQPLHTRATTPHGPHGRPHSHEPGYGGYLWTLRPTRAATSCGADALPSLNPTLAHTPEQNRTKTQPRSTDSSSHGLTHTYPSPNAARTRTQAPANLSH